MPQYMLPLLRSGAMWSCGQPAGVKPQGKFWSAVWRWIRAERPVRSVSLLYRGDVIKPGTRRY